MRRRRTDVWEGEAYEDEYYTYDDGTESPISAARLTNVNNSNNNNDNNSIHLSNKSNYSNYSHGDNKEHQGQYFDAPSAHIRTHSMGTRAASTSKTIGEMINEPVKEFKPSRPAIELHKPPEIADKFQIREKKNLSSSLYAEQLRWYQQLQNHQNVQGNGGAIHQSIPHNPQHNSRSSNGSGAGVGPYNHFPPPLSMANSIGIAHSSGFANSTPNLLRGGPQNRSSFNLNVNALSRGSSVDENIGNLGTILQQQQEEEAQQQQQQQQQGVGRTGRVFGRTTPPHVAAQADVTHLKYQMSAMNDKLAGLETLLREAVAGNNSINKDRGSGGGNNNNNNSNNNNNNNGDNSGSGNGRRDVFLAVPDPVKSGRGRRSQSPHNNPHPRSRRSSRNRSSSSGMNGYYDNDDIDAPRLERNISISPNSGRRRVWRRKRSKTPINNNAVSADQFNSGGSNRSQRHAGSGGGGGGAPPGSRSPVLAGATLRPGTNVSALVPPPSPLGARPVSSLSGSRLPALSLASDSGRESADDVAAGGASTLGIAGESTKRSPSMAMITPASSKTKNSVSMPDLTSDELLSKVLKGDDEESFEALWRRWLIHPNSTGRRIWDLAILIVLFYNAIVLPFRVCFDAEATGFLYVFETSIDVMFGVDLILNFRTAYFRDGTLITSPRRIALHYLRTWFVVDLVSSAPLDIIIIAAIDNDNAKDRNVLRLPRLIRLARLVRLLRLLRLFRLSRIFKKIQLHVTFNFNAIKLVKLAGIILLLSHFFACLWFLIAALNDLDVDTWAYWYGVHDKSQYTQYLASLHWAFATVTTVGYGDIVPKNNDERLFVLVSMMLGVTAFAYTVGSMSGLVQQMDFRAIEFHAKMTKVNQYLKYRRLPAALQIKIREHYRYVYDSESGAYEEAEILKELTPVLRTELAVHLNEEILRNIPFLKDATSAAITAVVLKLRPLTAQPGDIVVVAGEPGDHMYVITHGRAKVMSADLEKVYATLDPGSFFGEIALMYPIRRTATVVASEHCELYSLSKADFDETIKDFPDVRESLAIEATRRLKEIEQGTVVAVGEEYVCKLLKRMLRSGYYRAVTVPQLRDFAAEDPKFNDLDPAVFTNAKLAEIIARVESLSPDELETLSTYGGSSEDETTSRAPGSEASSVQPGSVARRRRKGKKKKSGRKENNGGDDDNSNNNNENNNKNKKKSNNAGEEKEDAVNARRGSSVYDASGGIGGKLTKNHRVHRSSTNISRMEAAMNVAVAESTEAKMKKDRESKEASARAAAKSGGGPGHTILAEIELIEPHKDNNNSNSKNKMKKQERSPERRTSSNRDKGNTAGDEDDETCSLLDITEDIDGNDTSNIHVTKKNEHHKKHDHAFKLVTTSSVEEVTPIWNENENDTSTTSDDADLHNLTSGTIERF